MIAILLSALLFLGISPSATSAPIWSIDKPIDLHGSSIQLEENCVLRFSGKGMLMNGRLVGHSNLIESDTSRPLFQKIVLEGEWRGGVSDAYFYRRPSNSDDWQIISNIMKFNEISFTRDSYFLTKWEPILVNDGNVIINGNGVRLFLPADKGKTRNTIWGKHCINECILYSQTSEHRIEINNLTFSDKSESNDGFGSDVSAQKPLIYYYLGLAHATVILNQVHSDGQGCLFKRYNYSQDIDRVEMSRCSVRTCQFAAEILNITRDNQSGHLGSFKMDSCLVYRYPNALFCGPISIVGREHGSDSISISNSTFIESNAGNIELSGVDHALFCNNQCTNLSFYDGELPPYTYECKKNTFILRQIDNPMKNRALSMGGRWITLSGNTYIIKSKPFPFIELLQPWLVECLTMTDNTIRYEPDKNTKGFSCLFSIKDLKGEFLFTGNHFYSAYDQPEIDCLFPRRRKTFNDPSKGKIRISWR